VKKLSWALLVTAALALGCGSGSKAPEPEKPTSVLSSIDVTRVEKQAIASGPRVSGSLKPAIQAVLRAEAGGTVLSVGAELGDEVQQGALLARIDNQAVTGSVASAHSGVALGQQDLANAKKDLERTQSLAAAGAVSGHDVEVAELAVASAQARLDQSRAGLAQAGQQLGGVIVKSPITGIVSQRAVSVGDIVAPGSPMFTVIDPSTLRLEASVPAADLSDVRVGGVVEFNVQGYSDQQFEGKIERVSPAVDPVTRQLPILVSVPNPGGTLIAGLFAEGRVAGELHDGLVVPADAVDTTGASPAVLRVKDGVIEKVDVKLGTADLGNERVEVATGLAEGDTLVVGPARSVAPGTTVQIEGS
jgi:RND family efflux transporter MFP subunit